MVCDRCGHLEFGFIFGFTHGCLDLHGLRQTDVQGGSQDRAKAEKVRFSGKKIERTK